MNIPDDTIDALRDELRRLRIERIGFVTDIEELKAEVARLRAENADLKARVPQKKKKKGGYKRKIVTVAPPSPAEGEAVLDELTTMVLRGGLLNETPRFSLVAST